MIEEKQAQPDVFDLILKPVHERCDLLMSLRHTANTDVTTHIELLREWMATSKGRTALDQCGLEPSKAPSPSSSSSQQHSLRALVAFLGTGPLCSRVKAGLVARSQRIQERGEALSTLLELLSRVHVPTVRQQLLRALLHYDASNHDEPLFASSSSSSSLEQSWLDLLSNLLISPTKDVDTPSRLLAVRLLATTSSPHTLPSSLLDQLASLASRVVSKPDDEDATTTDQLQLQQAAWLSLRTLTARIMMMSSVGCNADAVNAARQRMATLFETQLCELAERRASTKLRMSDGAPLLDDDQLAREQHAVQLLGTLRVIVQAQPTLIRSEAAVRALLSLAAPPTVSPRVARCALRLARTLLPQLPAQSHAADVDTMLERVGALLMPHQATQPPLISPRTKQEKSTPLSSLSGTATTTTTTSSNNDEEWLVYLTHWRLDAIRLSELLTPALGDDAFALSSAGSLTRGLLARVSSQSFARASIGALAHINAADDTDVAEESSGDVDESVVRRRNADKLKGVPLCLPLSRASADRLARAIAAAGGAVTMVEASKVPSPSDNPIIQRAFLSKSLKLSQRLSSPLTSSTNSNVDKQDKPTTKHDTLQWLSGTAAHALAADTIALIRQLLLIKVFQENKFIIFIINFFEKH